MNVFTEEKNPIKTNSWILLPHLLHSNNNYIVRTGSYKYNLYENVLGMFVFKWWYRIEIVTQRIEIKLTYAIKDDALQ